MSANGKQIFLSYGVGVAGALTSHSAYRVDAPQGRRLRWPPMRLPFALGDAEGRARQVGHLAPAGTSNAEIGASSR